MDGKEATTASHLCTKSQNRYSITAFLIKDVGMERYTWRWIVVAICAWLIAYPCVASEPSPDTILAAEQRLFALSGARGMVIAVIDGDHVSIHGYGETRPGSRTAPDAHSIVRIGSISKLLAADLMVKLAAQDKLRLTDPLQRFAPQGYRVPSSSRPITLLDLATHTSGLPRQASISDEDKTPYAQARWQWLQKQTDLPAPGQVAVYSNLAFDLLADALSHAAGMPYDQALQSDVTQPLNMRDTTDTPSASQCSRLMDGGGSNASAPCSDSSDRAGSGSMYSSAADMTLWMKQQLGIGQSGLHAETAISQAVYFQRQALADVQGMDNGGHADGLGMAWVLLDANAQHPAILEKTGGGGGFMTYLALAPGRQAGIFVAITRVDVPMLQALAAQVNTLLSNLVRQASPRHDP
jgi:serine-type D-Ala-D-Ala carboxypeptidase/endopeptidase